MKRDRLVNMKTWRKYGAAPYSIAVIYGGPGAAGDMGPVAREISRYCGVLEPIQTKSTVAEQADEMYRFLKKEADLPVTLIGYSWGAWLSLIFAAGHPEMVNKLVLVSSGPFEDRYARDIMKTRLERLDANQRREVEEILGNLGKNTAADNRLMSRLGDLISIADSYKRLPDEQDKVECHYGIYASVWKEAIQLRSSGKLLKRAGKVSCPVLAIHGDYDPHPAEGVKLPLGRTLKDFRFILLPKCGHQPWMEKEAREKFYDILKAEIT